MKKFLNKVVPTLIKFVPVCAALMLVINSNSTSTILNGQPEAPKGLKKYRKFLLCFVNFRNGLWHMP